MATDRVTYTDQVVEWLNHNPGFHSPVSVGAATGVNTTKAANALMYLSTTGRVKRRRSLKLRNGPGASTYSA